MPLNRLLNLALGKMLTQILKQKIREGTIRAARSYLLTIKTMRLVTLAIFGLGVAASMLVSGIVCVIVGLIGLSPSTAGLPVILIATGVVFALVALIGILMLFSQERWLRISRSYELIDTVLGPWPGVFPPNPLEHPRPQPDIHV